MEEKRNNIPSILFEGEEEDIDNFIRLYYNCQYISDKIRKIFENKVIFNEMIKKEDFDSPSWPYLRAYQDGYIKGIKEVLSYLPK
ncbi:MAG: hypothetical protein ACE5H1_00570 [Thermodesulfobacteriota bacterium]